MGGSGTESHEREWVGMSGLAITFLLIGAFLLVALVLRFTERH
ncbi:hypothetical protein AB0425_01750 [Actinosynnema sp. NPDC051121]